jgi:hypothetical protein
MRAFVALLCFAGSVIADSITVTVWCNGRGVAGLPISVLDSQGNRIPGISTTDQDGSFVNGSTCGSYDVMRGPDPSIGNVQLFYYPTSLPAAAPT